MFDPQNVIAFGVPLILLVLGLVEFAKKFGVQGNASVALAGGLGAIFMALNELTAMYPDIAPYYRILVLGLAFGLAAAGLYDLGKKYLAPKQ